MGINPLAALRARLAASEQNNNRTFDNGTFPFWNMKEGATSIIRFLPDGDPNNTSFWVEKFQIKLPFAGIKGGDAKPTTVTVPCMKTWGLSCPILAQISPWYEEAKRTGDEALRAQANKYWRKPVYIMQGFVRENAVLDDKKPENPIRRFMFNKQIFNLIKTGVMDPEMLNHPCDYELGTDFRITKTTKGQYADYGTSSYARRESALTQAERDSVEKYGLFNLSDFLGTKPGPEELRVIEEMFEASYNGESYDPERWGKFYRPVGLKSEATEGESNAAELAAEPETTNEAPVVTNSKPVVSEVSSPATPAAAEATPSTTSKKTANDILTMLKNRGNTATK